MSVGLGRMCYSFVESLATETRVECVMEFAIGLSFVVIVQDRVWDFTVGFVVGFELFIVDLVWDLSAGCRCVPGTTPKAGNAGGKYRLALAIPNMRMPTHPTYSTRNFANAQNPPNQPPETTPSIP